ncbi:curlin subunit CsgB [Alteromonadaceae bacterium M269]|nr:curlin subunit CsgB [Alteromonadaceae bacterium M269]
MVEKQPRTRRFREVKISNKNNENGDKKAILCGLPSLLLVFSMSYSAVCSSQDLLSGTELKDSPLSLSLSNAVAMPVGDQIQQLRISQYGINNEATISQLANAGNSLAVIQHGTNNLANLIQLGYGNTINLEQQGNNNFAEVIQEGNANVANIRQEGEQTFIVHQIGNDMVVNITQY